MPTAAKLVAAIALGILGLVLSEMVKALMPEVVEWGWFTTLNTILGVLCGWIVIGRRAGRGYSAAVGHGLTGAAALVFWAIFIQSANEMVDNALKRRYDGPFEALIDIFSIGVNYLITVPNATFWVTWAVGGILAGILAEAASRLWR